MSSANFKQQSGFTLVEIAIVLVIISLLLGGVLKGTELIENSKVRRSVNDINGVAAAYNAYVDRYRAIPGDDGNRTSLQGRGGLWTDVPSAGNSNGRLEVTRNQVFNAQGEHDEFWQHLKAAGFISGDPKSTSVSALPKNAFGGMIGVTTQVVNASLSGLKVCLSQVPGKAAMALDNQMDDGDGAKGVMRATPGNNNGAATNPNNTELAAPYSEDDTYTVCMRI